MTSIRSVIFSVFLGFLVIRAMLDVRAKLLLHLILGLRTMKKSRGQRTKVSERVHALGDR